MTAASSGAPLDPDQLTQQIVQGLLKGDYLNAAIRDQVTAQVAAKVEELGIHKELVETRKQLAEMQAGLAEGPPGTGRGAARFPNAPFESAAVIQMRQELGIPSPNWYNPDAEGAKVDGKFADFADFMRAVINKGIAGKDDPRLVKAPRDVNMQAGVQGARTGEEIELGGALVPEQFRPMLMNMQLQPTAIRGRAMVLPMPVPTITIPKIRDTSHENKMVFGGIAFNWLEVGDQITESEPDFGLIELNARALAGSTAIPNTLLQDAFVSFLELMMRLWSEAVPWIEEHHFFRGSGAGQPLGMYNAPARVEYRRAVANQISFADCAAMRARMLPSSRSRSIWVVNSEATPQLMAMQISDGGSPAYVPSLQDDVPDRFLGRPVIENEHASALGTTGDLALLDPFYYVIGDRQTLSMEASPHEKFSLNRTMLRGISRFDATPWLDSPITPANASSGFQQSPFVLLRNR